MPRYCTICRTISTVRNEYDCDKCGRRMKSFQGFKVKKKVTVTTPVTSE